jgi:hypothetical protein
MTRLMRSMAVAAAATIALSGSARRLIGQVTVNVSMTVNNVMLLSMNSITTDLGTPVTADFTAGGKTADGPILTVKANRAYHISVAGNSGTFGFVGPGTTPNPNKPASDLTWGPATGAAPGTCPLSPVGTAYTHNMGTPATLVTVATGAPAAGVPAPALKICYRTLWASTATGGTYSLVVNFTLSDP